jgi:hypothetical protein
MPNRLTLEVSVEQMAAAVRRMDVETRQTLISLVPELTESVAFVTTITYHHEDRGYLARCVPIDAVAWGETPDEASESLVDAVIDLAEALVEDCPNPDETLRQRLPYAQAVYPRRHSRDEVRALLGLSEDAVHIP